MYTDDRKNGVEEIIRTADGTWNKPEGEWHSVSYDFTPDLTKNYRFSLIADSGGTIWIDDISIYALSDGNVTGKDLLEKTASKIGGDFEDESYCTIPEPPENITGKFMGQNELRFSWTVPEEIKKVNVYRTEDGNQTLVTSVYEDEVSVKSAPYETWNYSFTAVDENENESDAVLVSGTNSGNVSVPVFSYGKEVTEHLKGGELSVTDYAYEYAELFVAVYNSGKLEAVAKDSGTGRLSAFINIADENLENKKAVAFLWNNAKPLCEKYELIPE